MAQNDICIKEWSEVLDFLVRLTSSKERIQEIRIKKHEKDKWTVSITKQRNNAVGLHDLFW